MKSEPGSTLDSVSFTKSNTSTNLTSQNTTSNELKASQAQSDKSRTVNTTVSQDGTDTSVYNVSNQTVIAKKKGNKSIVAVKKTNKTTGVSEPSADKEVDDTVRELQTKIASDKSGGK